MNRTFVVMAGSLIAMVGLIMVLGMRQSAPIRIGPTDGVERQPLMLYCAAANRAVMEAIRQKYEQECGRAIEIQYGASQTLLSSMEVSGVGDLFLPSDDSFIEIARQKHLVAEVLPVGTMHGVLVVRRGNPKGISSFDDLLRKDVRLIQASTEASAIGQVTKRVLSADNLFEKLHAATTAYRTTVTDVVSDVNVGAADVGIVFDVTTHGIAEVEPVMIPELTKIVSHVSLAVVATSKRAAEALHFARYVSARDRGLLLYTEFGFKTSIGDKWSDTPELSVFAGSMLRPAIDDSIKAFEEREGVRVSRVYNGCGILVAQMKAGQHPDAYFACDKEFMNSVPDIFPHPIDVSQNQLVIMVKKGNPHGIQLLRDLGKPGLRVGIGHEKQCAMGWITQNTLKAGGVVKEVMSNVTVQTPTGDMLVNQLRTGSLDAAVAYISNAAGAADFLDAIAIQGIECSVAVQPFGIAVDSPHAQTAQRLFERLSSVE